MGHHSCWRCKREFWLLVELIVPHEIAKFPAVDLIEGGRDRVSRTGASIVFFKEGLVAAGEDKLLTVAVGSRFAAKGALSIRILILVAGRKGLGVEFVDEPPVNRLVLFKQRNRHVGGVYQECWRLRAEQENAETRSPCPLDHRSGSRYETCRTPGGSREA